MARESRSETWANLIASHPIVVIATAVSTLIAIVVGALTIYDRIANREPLVDLEVDAASEAYVLWEELVASKGERVAFDVSIDAELVDNVSEGLSGDSQLDGTMEWFSVPLDTLEGEDRDGLLALQFNLVGLRSSDLRNSFGWAGQGRYQLRGLYEVVNSGIGTGGVGWVALQAVDTE